MLVLVFLCLSACILGQTTPPAEYRRDVQEASKLFAKDDLKAVIRILAPWVEKLPNAAEAQHGLGLAYYQQQDFAGAIRHLSVAIQLEKEDSSTWKQTAETLGMAYYFSNRAQDALPLLQKIATGNPTNSNLLYTLGMAYLFTRDGVNSRRTFARLFQVPSESPQAYMLTADLMMQEKYPSEAEALIHEARKQHPDLPEANYKLGAIALAKGEFSKAVEFFRSELATNPSHSMAWHYLGDAYLRAGNLDQAIDPLQRSIWLNLQSSRSYILLANVYARQERYFVAESALRRALDMDPQNYEAHFLLGRIYHKTNRTDLARKEVALSEQLRAAAEGKQ